MNSSTANHSNPSLFDASTTQGHGRDAAPKGFLIQNLSGVMTGLKDVPGHATRSRIGPCSIRIQDGRIAALGTLNPNPDETVLDARGGYLYPGWVNTHHHLFQQLLQAVPGGIDQGLMGWLTAVPYRFRGLLTPELIETSALVGMALLAQSGCTTVFDHHYIFWQQLGDEGAEAVIRAAGMLGLRLSLGRGINTVGREVEAKSLRQLDPEPLEAAMKSIAAARAKWHSDSPDSMLKLVVAPTTPMWSVEASELKPIAAFAREQGLLLHTHLSETMDYVRYSQERHGCKPVEFMAKNDWLGPDVWFAHMVHVDQDEIALLAQTQSAISHCPGSNCRLGSGIAPVPQYDQAGVRVSLGVDGAASNESGDMLNEARLAWYVHRARQGAAAIAIEDTIRFGSATGADVLGWKETGTIEPGKLADFVVYELESPRHLGYHDPALAPVAAGQARTRWVFVGGRMVVKDGAVLGSGAQPLDPDALAHAANRCVDALKRAAAA